MKKRSAKSKNTPESMNAGNAGNIRENLWLYRVYNGLSRYQMAEGITKPGQYRSYEYGSQHVDDKPNGFLIFQETKKSSILPSRLFGACLGRPYG